jgi:hypothetical protein
MAWGGLATRILGGDPRLVGVDDGGLLDGELVESSHTSMLKLQGDSTS